MTEAALHAVSARAVVTAAYTDAAWPAGTAISLLAVGKAASAMAHAFSDLHGLASRAW